MGAKVTSEIVDPPPPAEGLDRWWEPVELQATVDVQKQRLHYFEEMLGPQLKPLREAWVASRLAMILSQDRPVSIKLEADRFPDFTLRIREEILPFELTEAYQEGRRRDDEYRHAAARKAEGLPPVIEQLDPSEEEAAIPAIARAIEKKARKRYSSAPHLLVLCQFLFYEGRAAHHESFGISTCRSVEQGFQELLAAMGKLRLPPVAKARED